MMQVCLQIMAPGDRPTSSAEHEMKATLNIECGARDESDERRPPNIECRARDESDERRPPNIDCEARYGSGAAVSGMTQTEGWDTLARMGNHKRRQAN